jgi:hypothetical protein
MVAVVEPLDLREHEPGRDEERRPQEVGEIAGEHEAESGAGKEHRKRIAEGEHPA